MVPQSRLYRYPNSCKHLECPENTLIIPSYMKGEIKWETHVLCIDVKIVVENKRTTRHNISQTPMQCFRMDKGGMVILYMCCLNKDHQCRKDCALTSHSSRLAPQLSAGQQKAHVLEAHLQNTPSHETVLCTP